VRAWLFVARRRITSQKMTRRRAAVPCHSVPSCSCHAIVSPRKIYPLLAVAIRRPTLALVTCWVTDEEFRLAVYLHRPLRRRRVASQDTTRDTTSTRAQKPTWVNLIYRTEPTVEKRWTEKLKSEKRICSEVSAISSPGNPWNQSWRTHTRQTLSNVRHVGLYTWLGSAWEMPHFMTTEWTLVCS